MKRICNLRKVFNDGGRTIIEFVEVIGDRCREIRREYRADGGMDVSIYDKLSREQIQRDIALYMEQGYKKI
jgi:hypothetical protein